MSINIRLKQVMEIKGLNIKSFSEISGLKYRTLQNYLSGERKPDVDNLAKISTHLGVNLNWLLTGIGEPFVSTTPPAPVKLAPAAAVLRGPQGAYHVEAPLNERERQLLEDFRSANEQGQNAIEDAAKAMAAIAALAKNKVG